MGNADGLVAELAAMAEQHADTPPTASAVRGLMIRHSSEPTPPMPALFEPVFYVVLQRAKRLTFAGRTQDVATGACAVAAVGLPFVSQVIQASPTRPYVGVQLMLDLGVVADLLLSLPDAEPRAACWPRRTTRPCSPALSSGSSVIACSRGRWATRFARSDGAALASPRSGRRPSGSAPTRPSRSASAVSRPTSA